MDGTDVWRRVSWSRQEAEARARAAALWRQQRDAPVGTAAECLRVAKEPEKRLEPLRRQTGTSRAA